MIDKQDMSPVCGFGYEDAWENGTIEEYYDKYCAHCYHMNEICMYGEGEEEA